VSNEKGLSLFDIVRNNTLKGALLDDDLFIQHSRGIKNAYQQRESALRQYLMQRNKPSNELVANTKSQLESSQSGNQKSHPEPQPKQQPESKPEPMQNTQTQLLHRNDPTPLDKDSSIKQSTEASSSTASVIEPPTIVVESKPLDAQVIQDNARLSDNESAPAITNEGLDDEDIESECDDGIDYGILDDLEVVVFED
jgi:hypothetical protein